MTLYYFKDNNTRKRFYDFNNGLKLREKRRSGKIILEVAKKLKSVFKSNLNKISKGRFKLEEQQRKNINY